jgi:ABC-type transport system involved in multi-copper enzyme maturation permease subunit
MFLTLLLVTFAVSVLAAIVVARMFAKPIDSILKRIIADEISAAWTRYMKFAILVVGVSAGVRVYELERYISPARFDKDAKVLELTQDRWILEIYRTIIETLQGIAWLLLVFFVFALVAYVIVRIAEMKNGRRANQEEGVAPAPREGR